MLTTNIAKTISASVVDPMLRFMTLLLIEIFSEFYVVTVERFLGCLLTRQLCRKFGFICFSIGFVRPANQAVLPQGGAAPRGGGTALRGGETIKAKHHTALVNLCQ